MFALKANSLINLKRNRPEEVKVLACRAKPTKIPSPKHASTTAKVRRVRIKREDLLERSATTTTKRHINITASKRSSNGRIRDLLIRNWKTRAAIIRVIIKPTLASGEGRLRRRIKTHTKAKSEAILA